MKFKRSAMTLASASVVALGGLLVLPATAFASSPHSLWVNATGTVPVGATTGTSCAAPGFTAIQPAITAAPAKATIHVCSGTYAEQLQITSPVSLVSAGSSVTVELPPSPVNSTTLCDPALNSTNPPPSQDEISVCTSGTVGITGITVQALWPTDTCNDGLYGIFVGGGANLKMKNSEMDGAGAFPLNGCQGGVGIQVGRAFTSQVGHAALNNVKIVNYQKNGVTVDGPGSTATIIGSTVTGAGPSAIAQNGIQISRGAKGSIKTTTISGNECNIIAPTCGSDSLNNAQSAGVLFYGAASGSSVTKSTIGNNDLGVYAGAVTPNASTVTITHDVFGTIALGANRYESVVVDGATATVSNDTVKGGNVGLQLLQYGTAFGGQPFGSVAIAKNDTFNGLSVAAAQVYSDAVGAVGGDLPGSLSISKSKVSGNPTSVTGSVLDNSPPTAAYVVTLNSDT